MPIALRARRLGEGGMTDPVPYGLSRCSSAFRRWGPNLSAGWSQPREGGMKVSGPEAGRGTCAATRRWPRRRPWQRSANVCCQASEYGYAYRKDPLLAAECLLPHAQTQGTPETAAA